MNTSSKAVPKAQTNELKTVTVDESTVAKPPKRARKPKTPAAKVAPKEKTNKPKPALAAKSVTVIEPATELGAVVNAPSKRKRKPKEIYLCKKDLLAIIGTADPTRQAAPYEDPNFEIWGVAVASTYPDVKRLDVQFEMHTDEYWKRDKNVTDRLKKTEVPLYMHDHYKEIPTSMRFPIEIVLKYRKYFTSSIGYMLALAYHSFVMTGNPKHVALFGIHMQAEEEYGEQRPCCEYWLGRMEGAGMDIEVAPGGSLLISMGLYGYENYHPVCYDMRQRIMGLTNGIKQTDSEIKKWELQRAKNEGAIHEAEEWLHKFQRGEYK